MYHYNGLSHEQSVELSYEEVRSIILHYGFTFEVHLAWNACGEWRLSHTLDGDEPRHDVHRRQEEYDEHALPSAVFRGQKVTLDIQTAHCTKDLSDNGRGQTIDGAKQLESKIVLTAVEQLRLSDCMKFPWQWIGRTRHYQREPWTRRETEMERSTARCQKWMGLVVIAFVSSRQCF